MHPPPLHHALEAHATAAILYLSGTLTPNAAVGAFRSCYDLPRSVRRLRVDLRRVRLSHPAAADTLRILLTEWRRTRRGRTRLTVGADAPTGHAPAAVGRVLARRPTPTR
jgi:hypothetical protein